MLKSNSLIEIKEEIGKLRRFKQSPFFHLQDNLINKLKLNI